MGSVGKRNIGNTVLVEHGIQTCESEYIIHVCPKPGKIYIYASSVGLDAVESGLYPIKSVWTRLPNKMLCETAQGYPVPWEHLENIRYIDIPNDLLEYHSHVKNAPTSRKGRWAEWVVKEMMGRGLLTFKNIEAVNDVEMQIRGIDIQAYTPTYQVKYDGPGGHREFGGSGNLFLQIRECNPLGAT